MTPFAWLKYWPALVIGLLLVLLGVQEVRVNHAQAQASQARAELVGDRATYALAKATQEKAARAEETRREAEKERVIDEARTQMLAAETAARDAGRAAAGLRKQVASLIASRRSAPNPGVASGSPPATDPLDLLSDLFSGSDALAGELAEEADRRRIAGLACEASFDALTVQ